jgi:hypothetical protein
MITLKNSAIYISFLVTIYGNSYAITPEDCIYTMTSTVPIVVIDKTPLYARQSELRYAITVIKDMGEKPIGKQPWQLVISPEMSNVVHFMKSVAHHINSADQSEREVIAKWSKDHFLLQDHYSTSSSTLSDGISFMDNERLSSFAADCETIQKVVPDFTTASVLRRALQERMALRNKEIVIDLPVQCEESVQKPLSKLYGEEQKLNKVESLDNVENLDDAGHKNRFWSSIIKPSLLCAAVMIAVYYCYNQLYLKRHYA